jgi:hypothetical protein
MQRAHLYISEDFVIIFVREKLPGGVSRQANFANDIGFRGRAIAWNVPHANFPVAIATKCINIRWVDLDVRGRRHYGTEPGGRARGGTEVLQKVTVRRESSSTWRRL